MNEINGITIKRMEPLGMFAWTMDGKKYEKVVTEEWYEEGYGRHLQQVFEWVEIN